MEKLIDFIKKVKLSICTDDSDGRVNSISDEKTLIKHMLEYGKENNISVYEPPARHWYDIMWNNHPIQIKSSSCNAADNWNSKKSLLYALTDMSIDEIDQCPNKHSTIQELLVSRISKKDKPRDMNILVINKNDGAVQFKKLCELDKLTVNGNNLPFQIHWGNNLSCQPNERTRAEATKFILEAYLGSICKKRQQDRPELLESLLR